jgi:hypothetical protein
MNPAPSSTDAKVAKRSSSSSRLPAKNGASSLETIVLPRIRGSRSTSCNWSGVRSALCDTKDAVVSLSQR